ncbi:hypothetical protein AAG570_008741 [Ranatra chinensis]|uniref:Major facilitator superfamily (MFS) profile domain-containing protein n=1 Tax=Ranatra chinensis TaxID=642074 RepID=A0ABD0YTY5_9HEMI
MSATKFPGIWSLLSIVFLAPPIKFHCADSNTTCPDNCTRWVYDRSVFKETIVSQWDLVCSKRQLVNVGQLVFVAGVMIGNLFFSVYSDRIGRKIPMVVSGVLQGLAGIVAGLMPCYTGFVFFRFIQAFAVAGGICTTHVLCAEVLGARSRASVGVVTHVAVFIGTGFTAVVAHFTRHWRYFQIAISVPSLFVGAYWWLVPESPRWLLAVGRNEEALKILKSAASWNKNPIPEYLPEQIGSQTRIENKNKKATLLDLVKTPNVRKKNLNIWFSFGVVALNFYGIEQYLTEVGENMFINVAVSGVVMVPGVLLSMYTMNKFGRRVTLFASQFISAASCFIIIPIPEENERLRSAFAILGVTGAAVSFTTVFLFGSELFPTVARNMGMGVGCTCSRVGAMIAPFVVSMVTII